MMLKRQVVFKEGSHALTTDRVALKSTRRGLKRMKTVHHLHNLFFFFFFPSYSQPVFERVLVCIELLIFEYVEGCVIKEILNNYHLRTRK